jgi:hypothetical protein
VHTGAATIGLAYVYEAIILSRCMELHGNMHVPQISQTMQAVYILSGVAFNSLGVMSRLGYLPWLSTDMPPLCHLGRAACPAIGMVFMP